MTRSALPWVVRRAEEPVAGLQANALDLSEVVDLLGEALRVAGALLHTERR